jgi:predicted ATPase with chaperone activity
MMQDFYKTDLFGGATRRPQSFHDIDVRQSVLEDLALKILYLSGTISILELGERMKLGFEISTDIFGRLRTERFCQVSGMAGNIPHISITSEGRTRALELLTQCHYAGHAPVTLESYVNMARRQSVRDVSVHPPDVERAFAHLVIDEKSLRQFGTALNSGSAIFLYGPPGTGKTTIAETLSKVLSKEDVWIPYAVEVDGQIITVYDPAIHKRNTLAEPRERDERWVLCQRPTVLVGGELTIDMLDLEFNPQTRFYVGPVQMKANNGVLILDDFGRQRVSPAELLNRWVVPLDRRIDFLTLAGGKKIEMPFEMLVVFASNLDPATLVDAAFLRRIQTKIHVGAATDEQFTEIFRRVAKENEIEVDDGICQDLIAFIRGVLDQELRSCHPRDIVNQVRWAARFEGTKPRLDRTALMRAVEAYFLPHANPSRDRS